MYRATAVAVNASSCARKEIKEPVWSHSFAPKHSDREREAKLFFFRLLLSCSTYFRDDGRNKKKKKSLKALVCSVDQRYSVYLELFPDTYTVLER